MKCKRCGQDGTRQSLLFSRAIVCDDCAQDLFDLHKFDQTVAIAPGSVDPSNKPARRRKRREL